MLYFLTDLWKFEFCALHVVLAAAFCTCVANLVFDVVLCSDDITEAYDLIKDLDPTNPQEYIIKAVVNASLGQEQQSVCRNVFVCSCRICI